MILLNMVLSFFAASVRRSFSPAARSLGMLLGNTAVIASLA
jgi:hypothetical protein